MKPIVAVGASMLLVACSSGTKLVIVNESAETLHDIVASGSGFSAPVDSVPPHSTRQFIVRPRGESELQLTFTADGKPVHSQGPYFESGYQVTATVSPQLQVSFTSQPGRY